MIPINLLLYIPLLVELNDKEKKAIGILAAIILFVFLLFGLVARLLLAIKDRKGREIDNYMYDMVKYKVIQNPSKFKSYVFKRESKMFYLKNRWFIRIGIVVGVALLIYVMVILKGSFEIIYNIMVDFFPKYEIPTTSLFGLTIISDWPILKQAPQVYLSLDGYVSYITMLVGAVLFLKLLCSSFVYYSKIDRSNKVASKAFGKNLDNVGGGGLHGFD